MAEALGEFIDVMTGSLATYGTNVGSAFNATAKNLLFEVPTTGTDAGTIVGLSSVGGIVAIASGVALCGLVLSQMWAFVTSIGR